MIATEVNKAFICWKFTICNSIIILERYFMTNTLEIMKDDV